tara:strand:- start:1284 stop:1496 length:213 start_codon:yes stop_codon:yes gene_type:complete
MVVLRDDHLLKLNYMTKSKGLGDSIEKFTTATGIKSFAQVLARNGIIGKKKDCGCNKRKDKLNKAFPYKK